LALHLWDGPLHFSVGLQICAIAPAATFVEYSLGANPKLHEMAEENLKVEARSVRADEVYPTIIYLLNA